MTFTGARKVSVADIAMVFNTTPELTREAVAAHPWLFTHHDDNPADQFVERQRAGRDTASLSPTHYN